MTLRNPYWFSVFGHMAVLSALMLLSSLSRPPLFVGGVSIVMPPPGSGPGKDRASAPAVPSELDPEAAVEREEQPPPEEREQRRPQPELNVVKQPDPDGLLPLPEDDVPSERPDQRDPEPRPEEPLPPPPAPDDNAPDGPLDSRGVGKGGTSGNSTTGSGSGIGVEGGVLGAHAPWYLVQLHDKIAANWRPPPVIGRDGQALAKFHFVLQADGSVQQVEALESSGARNYDMSGMRAIYNSSPLPPIPEDLGEKSLGITLTFSKTY